MEVALIAPISQLHHCIERRYHMAIPAFDIHEAYTEHFRVLSLNPGNYIILDNGAFEGPTLGPSELLDMAVRYRVREVIAPDTLRDADASFEQLAEFMSVYRHPSRARSRPKSVMVAVQGTTIEECMNFVRKVVDRGYTANPTGAHCVRTLGIPKHLVETTGRSDIRIELARWVQKTWSFLFQVHFLGFVSPGDTMEGARLGVRSMDTSAPFICTAENVPLAVQPCEVPPRQRWFDMLGPEYFHPKLVRTNIETLDRWASYDGT